MTTRSTALATPDAADHGPTLKYVQANGVRFAYLEQGSGPLVMGPDHRRIGRPVGAAFNSIEADPRDVKALQPVIVDQRQARNGRRLPKQTQRIGPPPLVKLVGP